MKVLRYIAKFNGRLQYFEEELKKQEYQNLLKEIREGVIPIPISTPKSEAIESPRITDQKLELETKNRLTTNENQIITLNNNNANDNNSSNNDKNNNKDKISENSDKIIKKVTTNLTNGSHNQKDAGLQKEKSSNKKKLSPLALLKYPSIRYTFLLFCILWFFSSGLYSGLTIGVKNLPGSIYLNSLLLFIAETPGYFISGIAMNNRILGRKYSLVMFTSLFTLGNLLLYILFNYETPSIVIYLITRFFVVSAFVIYYTYSLESYPISIAQLAYGINGSCNSLGGIVVPFVIEYVDNRTLYLIYAIFGIVCVLLMLLLKETNGQPVRDQIIEIEQIVNRAIKDSNIVTTTITTIDQAKALGAQAVFGEKYGSAVRLVEMAYSKELCGGTHVKNTEEIGNFVVLSVESKGSGIFRIEGTTAKNVETEIKKTLSQTDDEIKELFRKYEQINENAK